MRIPENEDIAVIRADPGKVVSTIEPSSFVHMVRIMRAYAKSIDFMIVESAQEHVHDISERSSRLGHLKELKSEIIQKYQRLPPELRFGAIFYRAAIKSCEAGPYLVMHFFSHLRIAFLTQEIITLSEQQLSVGVEPNEAEGQGHDPVNIRPAAGLSNGKANSELYRTAINSIADSLTSAKFIGNPTLLATFSLLESFFHAGNAYIHDVLQLQSKEQNQIPTDNEQSAFSIPSHTSLSMVSYLEDDHHFLMPSTTSGAESTRCYPALIAKTSFHLIRQAIKDMAEYYAGAGWVDAVLDLPEKGLRDVDLTIVSESISTFIRLHDLRDRGRLEKNPHLVGSSLLNLRYTRERELTNQSLQNKEMPANGD